MSTDKPIAAAVSDAKGAYEFTELWPGDVYRVEVSAAGYSKIDSKMVRASRG